ncbi:MAG: sulfotransferase [Bacteroidetes bacterium]|nr:sulfotransferase [Bacteroidota bacterium]
MIRIHVVGCGPLTGTTLITKMMIACFDIDLCTSHENSIYVYPPRLANIFLTKMPQNLLVIEPLLRVMPNLYVIYMLRDPRDMIVSKHSMDKDRYWASLTYWKTYTPYGRKLQPHPRFITIRYEDLVTQPDVVQEYLMKKMPFLVKRDLFSKYHELAHPSEQSEDALGGIRPISSSGIGNWREHLPRVAGQLQIHGSITNDLIDYGYEKDGTWEKELERIEPDRTASHWPEHFTKAGLKRRKRGKYFGIVPDMLGHYRLTRPVRWMINVLFWKLSALL